MKPGLHLLHKPVGPTSFSLVQTCIESVRTLNPHKRPKVCHGGTLDPFASGLLLILVGEATRLFDHLHAIPKVYEATVRWGIETDNGDPLGKVIATGDASSVSATQLEDAIGAMIGWQEQRPHITSAKRVDGERAYVRAHRGEVFEMPASRVYLHEARWMEHDLPHQSRLRVVVRGGYYVRALARDLGRAVGCGAHLSALCRTSIGPWDDPGAGKSVEVHGKDLLPWTAARELNDQEVGTLRQGGMIDAGNLLPPGWDVPAGFPDPGGPVRGFHLGMLRFLLQEQNGKLKSVTEFRNGL